LRGTDGSNPSPSSGESRANLISSIKALKFAKRDGVTRRYAIEDAVASLICAQLLFLEADNPNKDINFYINSVPTKSASDRGVSRRYSVWLCRSRCLPSLVLSRLPKV
jgi:hypothetical protein